MAPRRRALLLSTLVLLVLAAIIGGTTACGSDDAADGRPRVVVTTPVLGSLVQDVVGGAARVTVLMPNGADPHEFQPSARDVEALTKADLVVENGLDLEENMHDALDAARGDGVPFFTASDHVRVRTAAESEASDEAGSEDPHIWMDPIGMRSVVAALGTAAGARPRHPRCGGGPREQARLSALDRQVRRILAAVPRTGAGW